MSFISSWGIESRYCCVVSEAGEYLTLVLVQKIADPSTGEKTDQIQNCKLKDGERLVEAAPPTMRPYAGAAGYIYPRWDDDTDAWIEAATAEQIDAWEAEHPAPAVDLDTLRVAKQEQNKQALADWLATHPLTWTDGNVYGVTEEDQNEMAINLAQYQLAVAAEQPAVLEWHAQKKQCHAFTIEQYTALSLAIAAYVYPYRRYQEQVKAAIYTAESEAEIHAIKIDYGSVGAAA